MVTFTVTSSYPVSPPPLVNHIDFLALQTVTEWVMSEKLSLFSIYRSFFPQLYLPTSLVTK